MGRNALGAHLRGRHYRRGLDRSRLLDASVRLGGRVSDSVFLEPAELEALLESFPDDAIPMQVSAIQELVRTLPGHPPETVYLVPVGLLNDVR
jgi:hypothetical protein